MNKKLQVTGQGLQEWDRQELMLEKIKKKEIKNPLIYEEFIYEKNEWDNIPGIVPKYVIYLSKYISGLSSFCYNLSQKETVNSIRDYTEDQLKEIRQIIEDKRNADLEEKKEIN